MDSQPNSIEKILDLPIVNIDIPFLSHFLYVETLNMMIGLKDDKYQVWNIKQNQIKKNEELTQLIQKQQKIVNLPHKNKVLGQYHLIITVFDLKNCKIIYQFPIQSEYMYILDTDFSSERLFMKYTGRYCALIYNINNLKSQTVFLNQSFNGLFGKYTYCLYNWEKQNMYRSKMNKKVRTTYFEGNKLIYSDQWMIYQEIKWQSLSISIVNNTSLQKLSFSHEGKQAFFRNYFIIDNLTLIQSSNNLIIMDLYQNQILKEISIGDGTNDKKSIQMFIGYKPNSCIYVFRN